MSDVEILTSTRRPIPGELITGLYRQVGWWPKRSAARLEEALSVTTAVGAWTGGSLVGFARAVSDGTLRAFIEDVVVATEYRRRGIATSMLHVLVDELREVDTLTTFCDTNLLRLYEAVGFEATTQVVLHRRHSR